MNAFHPNDKVNEKSMYIVRNQEHIFDSKNNYKENLQHQNSILGYRGMAQRDTGEIPVGPSKRASKWVLFARENFTTTYTSFVRHRGYKKPSARQPHELGNTPRVFGGLFCC